MGVDYIPVDRICLAGCSNMIEEGTCTIKNVGAASNIMEKGASISEWVTCQDNVEGQISLVNGRHEVS